MTADSQAAATPGFRRVQPPAEYTEAIQAFLRTTKFYDQGKPLNAHQVLSNHPPAARSLNRFLDWGEENVLNQRERRMLILRTAALAHCAYESNVHRQQSLRSGDLSEAESVSPRERALLAIADAICRTNTLSDDEWATAVVALSVPDIIECLIVVGYYRMCSGLMNALAVPDEGEMSPLATAAQPSDTS
jgi:alkylhydroperoxidase family enzyme